MADTFRYVQRTPSGWEICFEFFSSPRAEFLVYLISPDKKNFLQRVELGRYGVKPGAWRDSFDLSEAILSPLADAIICDGFFGDICNRVAFFCRSLEQCSKAGDFDVCFFPGITEELVRMGSRMSSERQEERVYLRYKELVSLYPSASWRLLKERAQKEVQSNNATKELEIRLPCISAEESRQMALRLSQRDNPRPS